MSHKLLLLLATGLLLLSTNSYAFASSCTTLTKNLSRGRTDSQVSELQQFLFDKGYLTTTPNGYFGTLTTVAVKKFQADNKLTQTGRVGPLTRSMVSTLSCTIMEKDTSSSQVGTVHSSINGVNGVNGVNGINAINGVNGVNGINGMNAVNGINGVNGVNGINGMNGVNGSNGVNGTQLTKPSSTTPAATPLTTPTSTSQSVPIPPTGATGPFPALIQGAIQGVLPPTPPTPGILPNPGG